MKKPPPIIRENLPEGKYLGSYITPEKMPGDLPEVCFMGRSNSGKSSLVKALFINRREVKTSSKPGHTVTINLFSWGRGYLADLPGFGYAKISHSRKEQLSEILADYLTGRTNLRAGFLLLDCRRKPEAEELYIIDLFRQRNIPLHLLLTKVDRLNQKEQSALLKQWKKSELPVLNILAISSQNGHNIDYLLQYLRTMGL